MYGVWSGYDMGVTEICMPIKHNDVTVHTKVRLGKPTYGMTGTYFTLSNPSLFKTCQKFYCVITIAARRKALLLCYKLVTINFIKIPILLKLLTA